jgi:hypothetical protein
MYPEPEPSVLFSVNAWHYGDGSRRYSIECECGSLLEAVTPGGLGLAVETHVEEAHGAAP